MKLYIFIFSILYPSTFFFFYIPTFISAFVYLSLYVHIFVFAYFFLFLSLVSFMAVL